jgi:hypothetical protein
VRALDAARQQDFVIGLVLASGPLDAICWLRRRYGDDTIRDWIFRHRGRQLRSQQVRFWDTLIELSAVDVRQWLEEPERRFMGRGARPMMHPEGLPLEQQAQDRLIQLGWSVPHTLAGAAIPRPDAARAAPRRPGRLLAQVAALADV